MTDFVDSFSSTMLVLVDDGPSAAPDDTVLSSISVADIFLSCCWSRTSFDSRNFNFRFGSWIDSFRDFFSRRLDDERAGIGKRTMGKELYYETNIEEPKISIHPNEIYLELFRYNPQARSSGTSVVRVVTAPESFSISSTLIFSSSSRPPALLVTFEASGS